MKATLIASCFGPNQMYARLARVLEHSARVHCPGWDIQVRTITPPRLTSAMRNAGHIENTVKMEHWAEAVAAAPDGACLLLTDADMMVTRPLDDLWALDFDLAYTVRETHLPFNSGVVAVRVGPALRLFIEAWRQEQRTMLGNAVYHQVWRQRFGGINQAALGKMLTRQAEFSSVRILALPCREWNCEDTAWKQFDPKVTRLVHIKSALRRAVFGLSTAHPPELAPLIQRWHDFEREKMRGDDGAPVT